MATKLKKTEAMGAGGGLQLLGVVLIVLGAFMEPVGLVFFGGLGLLLLIYGGLKANVLKCSDCMGKVEKDARVCPHCRADLK
jgi:hypothetical protein